MTTQPDRSSTPSRSSLGRTLGILAVAAAVLGALTEVGLRVDDYVRRGVPLLAVPSLEYDLILRDSLGPRGRPNGRFQKWQLNSAGFRSDEAALTARPGCTRVMTMGSSETFGLEESARKEYPAQLADSLAQHGCFQVLSAAIPGMGLRGLITYWERWASRYKPDVVVILANPMTYLGNDPPGYTPPIDAKLPPQLPPSFRPRALIRAKEVVHYPDMIQQRRVQRQLEMLTSGRPTTWFFSAAPSERVELYRRDLDSMIVSVRARGAEPVLIVHPMRFGPTFDAEDRALMAAWRTYTPRASSDVMIAFEAAAANAARDVGHARQVQLVDLASTMNGHRDWFTDFVHYSDTGAGVVAGGVGQGVRDAIAARGRAPNADKE